MTNFDSPDPVLPITIVLVEPRLSERLATGSQLVAPCFHVTATDSFAEAKTALATNPPALLITELRLGEYNGLHLVLRGKAARPDMAAIVFSDVPDVVLEAEAKNLGATMVVRPLPTEELLAAISRLTLRIDGGQELVRPFERRHQARRARTMASILERRTADRRRNILGGSDPSPWSGSRGGSPVSGPLFVSQV